MDLGSPADLMNYPEAYHSSGWYVRTQVSCILADMQQIEMVCLGTTHFINALIRREDLTPVAVLRLCGPATYVASAHSNGVDHHQNASGCHEPRGRTVCTALLFSPGRLAFEVCRCSCQHRPPLRLTA